MIKSGRWFFVIAVTLFALSVGCSGNASRMGYDVDLESGNTDVVSDSDAESDLEDMTFELVQESDFINGFAWVTGEYNYYNPISSYYGIIDTSGNLVVPLIYDQVFSFDYDTRGLTWVSLAETEKWGLIDTADIDTVGNVVVPYIYDDVLQMDNDNRAWVEIDGKCGLLDSDGNVLVPFEYENVFFYDKGTAAVMLGGKWGFVDSDNNVIVPFKYDYVSSFSNGLARVVIADEGNAFFPRSFSAPGRNWLKGKFGFVDMSGNEVIPPIYDYANPVFDDNGHVYVELAGYSGMLDTSGKAVGAFKRITS